jgi:hypothetical protein
VANDDEDESEEEDEVINGDEIDSLKQKLKEAMGDAAAGSGDEESEDDDMTDEQMMNIDDAIGNAFKSMVRKIIFFGKMYLGPKNGNTVVCDRVLTVRGPYTYIRIKRKMFETPFLKCDPVD